MAFFILSLLSARDLDIEPEGRYQSRADDKGNMKKAMCNKSIICGVLFASGAITFYEGNDMLSALL
jgi:hypothetical protein